MPFKMIEPADEKCLSCGHNIADHAKEKCVGVYNTYDVHGDETVGCACKAFDHDLDADIQALEDIARALVSSHQGDLK